jgi:undecaprenyl-diphosphatase
MPSAPDAFLLGLLHGPAELLPVSSSAHVALALRARGEAPSKDLEVALHAGTLLALGPVRPSRFLVAATLPPAAAGLLLERPIEQRLGGPRTVAAGLLLGGLAMAAADASAPRGVGRVVASGAPQLDQPSVRAGWWLGLAQAAALWPGVSRLGATLTAARVLGLGREDARRVATEAGIPVLAGATVLKGARLVQTPRRRRPGRELRARGRRGRLRALDLRRAPRAGTPAGAAAVAVRPLPRRAGRYGPGDGRV